MSRLSDPAEDWVEILKLYGGRCWICGALWEHKDHYVLRALGGADEPDNWRSACRRCSLVSDRPLEDPLEVLPRKPVCLLQTSR